MLSGCNEAADTPVHVTPKVVSGDIPCAPREVLESVCQQCHSSPPKNGAPFPLVTYGDVQAEVDGQPIWHWMEQYVSEGDMPLAPVGISAEDRQTLLDWLRAGAPSGDPNCAADTGPETSACSTDASAE